MKTSDFIKSLANKVGILDNDPNLLKAIEALGTNDPDLAPEFTGTIDRQLLTLAVAKTHPDVLKAVGATAKAELYNGLDAELVDTMTELGLTDVQKTEILAEKSSTKRASLLAKKVREYEGLNNKDASAADKKELLTKVNDLNASIAKIQKEHADALAAKEADIASKLLNKDIETDLLGYNYVFPKETPSHIKLTAAKASIDRQLAAKGAKVVIDETGNRKIVRADGTDYTDENHRSVSYKDFLNGALAQDKLLLANDPQDPGKKKLPQGVDPNPGAGVNQSLVEAADSDLQGLLTATKG